MTFELSEDHETFRKVVRDFAGLCQREESRADISSARDGHDARDRAMRENAALMQHDDIIVVRNFVDEMRGPQHGDTLSNHFVHVAEDSGS